MLVPSTLRDAVDQTNEASSDPNVLPSSLVSVSHADARRVPNHTLTLSQVDSRDFLSLVCVARQSAL